MTTAAPAARSRRVAAMPAAPAPITTTSMEEGIEITNASVGHECHPGRPQQSIRDPETMTPPYVAIRTRLNSRERGTGFPLARE
jgi:hypothetical protein